MTEIGTIVVGLMRLRTLCSVVGSVFPNLSVEVDPSPKELGADAAFTIKDGRVEYLVAHYEVYTLPNGIKSSNPMWGLECITSTHEPEPGTVKEVGYDIDFNAVCVKLVTRMAMDRAYIALRDRKERPTISDDLRLCLEEMLEYAPNQKSLSIRGLISLLMGALLSKSPQAQHLSELERLAEHHGGDLLISDIL